MLEKALKLDELLADGWKVVVHPIESPLCSKAEAYFAEALQNSKAVEEAIVRIEDATVRILFARAGIYRRVESTLTLLEKKKASFGRGSSLVTGGPFQGWIVASSRIPNNFLLGRKTSSHLDAQEFDRIKAKYAVNLTTDIPYIGKREVWYSEYAAHCNGSNYENSSGVFLDGEHVSLL